LTDHDRVLASFYYGNLTYPSTDPPKIGFLSTVPSDADQELKNASNAASAAGNMFPGEFRPSLHSRHLFLVLVSFLYIQALSLLTYDPSVIGTCTIRNVHRGDYVDEWCTPGII
jgi:hypothetical protein